MRSTLAAGLGVLVFIGFVLIGIARAGNEEDVRAMFDKFVAAQNAHDIKAVSALLQDSPEFLWVFRGSAILGREAALKQFEENYKGTWSLEPAVAEIKVTRLSPDLVRVYAPTTFMVGPAGQQAQPRRFLLNQIWLKTDAGWQVSTIIPVPLP